ncbi:MAG: type II CAAX prenyl endopeptidase Rce1 family protein [Myxococcota bacterium]
MNESEAERFLKSPSGPLDDLALTLPLFVAYHLGVVFLPTRNAADLVTHELVSLAQNDLLAYSGLTLAIGLLFSGVLLVLGRKNSLHWQRFALVALEGVLYAVMMRLVAGYVVGRLRLDAGSGPVIQGALAGSVMSLGAGFYEELVFRVGLFGLGLPLVRSVFQAKQGTRRIVSWIAWGAFSAALFSGWHYVGEFGDPFELRSFIFRWVCGLVFTAIYAFRGFAPVVWTHTLYDLWVIVL